MPGNPTATIDQQGLVFAVAVESGVLKLYDLRSYDKGPFDTFLVGRRRGAEGRAEGRWGGGLRNLSGGHKVCVGCWRESARGIHRFTCSRKAAA